MTEQSQSKQEDLTQLVASLETHFVDLERELAGIASDIETCDALLAKYGDVFSPSLHHLRQLYASKKLRMREIVELMEGFHRHISSGRRLVRSIASDQTVARNIVFSP